YVIAAGNESRNVSNVTPAKVAGAITVGSYDINGDFSSFSNWGPKVDILAPGEDIVSLSPNGGPVAMTGTSKAASPVTGAAALYLSQNPTASPSQVEAALVALAQSFVTGTSASSTTNKSVWVGGL
ncbi:MAG: S8 family serine peptidase, partial [Gemmatimonadetes bacterium]|nr:S8 family serine peptidase [Gemmatimonadota bacterium]